MSKQYGSGSKLQQKLLEGIDTLADNVASTMGPRGRSVILHQKGNNPIITKDGVTVAKFVELEDPFQNAGAQILKQASEETNNTAGDGTTTATVLARAVFKKARKYISAGASPVELKRGMDKAVDAIVERIDDMAKPIMSSEDIEHIASISANGDIPVGKLISKAIDSAGKDGAITVEEARSVETSLSVVEGFRLDSGFLSSQFITDERRGVVRYDNPMILVTDTKIETVDEMLPALELAAREGRPFVIIAENIEGQALAALIMNAVRGTMKVAAVKAPRYGEERRNVLKDLALATGATLISREYNLGLKDAKLVHYGSAKSIEITKNVTTVVDGEGDYDQIDERIEDLKVELEQTESLPECERIQERITRLASGIAIIRVGAPTEIEMIEKKHRIEDALEAVRSAQLEGIVPGGGIALLRTLDCLDDLELDNEDQEFGADVLAEAIKEPARQMASNAGRSPDILLQQILNAPEEHGVNFATGEMVDMYSAGIVDPAKVTKTALKNAVSAAATLISTNFAIIEI